jgi:hypothetical protein
MWGRRGLLARWATAQPTRGLAVDYPPRRVLRTMKSGWHASSATTGAERRRTEPA